MSSSRGTAIQGRRRQMRSCAECRRRKIRCVWPKVDGNADTAGLKCEHCSERRMRCVSQSRARVVERSTTGDRVRQLEREMQALVSMVRTRRDIDFTSPSMLDGESATPPVDSASTDAPRHEVEAPARPSHLQHLFDPIANELRGSLVMDPAPPMSTSVRAHDTTTACIKLKSFLSIKEHVNTIAPYASEWLALYHTLFPAPFLPRTPHDLIANYDSISKEEHRPVRIAMYLLSVAITVQQMPLENRPSGFYNDLGCVRFVDDVCLAVERQVMDNNALAASSEGLDVSLLCIRLSLGRASPHNTWLSFRRVVALAELAGLPQARGKLAAGSAVQRQDLESLQTNAEIWEGICATDRNYSMMLNLPAATARYSFPHDESLVENGNVKSRAYNYRLAAINGMVHDIDEAYASKQSEAKTYEAVLNADRHLRQLASAVPTGWWDDIDEEPLDQLMVKFWHFYVMMRIHLRPSTIKSPKSNWDEYAYSKVASAQASREAVNRFLNFRLRVPAGLSVCRMLDLQGFTSATFLLLQSLDQRHNTSADSSSPMGGDTTGPVRRMARYFSILSTGPSSDIAQEASAALELLLGVLQATSSDRQSMRIGIHVPLLGKVYVNAPAPSPRGSIPASEVNGTAQHTSRLVNLHPRTLTGDGSVSLDSDEVVSWSLDSDGSNFWTIDGGFLIDGANWFGWGAN